MAQLNMHLTQEFERDLRKFMKYRHLKTKTAAIKLAVKEGLAHTSGHLKTTIDFSNWLGLGLQATQNEHHKFKSNDDLWE